MNLPLLPGRPPLVTGRPVTGKAALAYPGSGRRLVRPADAPAYNTGSLPNPLHSTTGDESATPSLSR